MFLHRWSKLSQILHMSYCSSCRHYQLPSREISHVKWGGQFPYSILALRKKKGRVLSSVLSDKNISLFWKGHFFTLHQCLKWAPHKIPLWNSVLQKLASTSLKPHLLPMKACDSFNMDTINKIHYFIQLQTTALRLFIFGRTVAK